MINTKIKTTLGEYVIKNNISTLDIAYYMEDIANNCKGKLEEEMLRFGLDIVNFFIESINVPDEDLNTINNILNKKAEFDIMGDARYQTSRGYDVLEKAAGSDGAAGSVAAAGVGLGLGIGATQTVGNMMKQSMADKAGVICPKCGHNVKDAKFCPNCGNKVILECGKCKKAVPLGTKFCPDCGNKIE